MEAMGFPSCLDGEEPACPRRGMQRDAHAPLLQLCLTLCNPLDCKPQVPLSMELSVCY